jgi:hypothetical protein
LVASSRLSLHPHGPTSEAREIEAYSGADGCVSQGTYACPAASVTSGTMRVAIDSSSGGACLPAGNYTCAFALNGNAMAYDCTGAGQLQYRR